MSNDKNKKPPEEAAANNLYANIMLNYFNAAPPMHMDGTPVEDCPWEKEVKKALDSANPIEAFERLTDEDEHIDIPEDATEWRALIDKISSNPIFKELPFVAQQELQEQAAESLEEAKDALQVLEEFGERDKADRADVERQMLKQARKVLIDNTRLTVSTSTETKDGDAFLYRNLQEDPSSVAVVEGMMKGLITRAARAAAIPLAGYVSMGGQLLPRFTDKDKRKKQAATLKDMTAAVDAETVAAMILEAIPQTFGYFKEHAPERAATLEEYARQEAKAAFASIIEYVEAVNAEPVEEAAAEDEQAGRKSLPFFKMSRPQSRYSTIDNISAKLFYGDGALVNPKKPVPVYVGTYGGKKCPKKKIYNFVSVTPEKGAMQGVSIVDGRTGNVMQFEDMSPFYREVFSAICSKVAEEERDTGRPGAIMTVGTIYQTLTGKDNARSMTADMKADIIECINVMSHYWITIEAKEESKLYNNDVKPRYHGLLIPAEYVDFVAQGNKKVDTGIHVFRNSVLFYFAEDEHRLTSYPVEMLNAPINNTKSTITLKGYLANRIKSKGQKPIVKMDTLFDYLCIDAEDKSKAAGKQRTKARKDALKYFEYCKEQGFIKDFTPMNGGNEIKLQNKKNPLQGRTIDAIKFVRA